MRVDILTPEQAAHVRSCIRSPDVKVIWDMGVSTGLRISDILALRVDKLTKKDCYIREQKTGKIRRIYIRKSIRSYFIAKLDSGAMHPQSRAFSISRSQVWRDIKDAAKRAGVQTNVGSHTMRKTYAKAYAQKKGVYELKKRLNHDKLADTIGYITSNADLGLDEKGYPKKRKKHDSKGSKRKAV